MLFNVCTTLSITLQYHQEEKRGLSSGLTNLEEWRELCPGGSWLGWWASLMMRGGGYGLIDDIVVGLIGAFIGGWLAGVLGIGGSSSLIVSIIIAFIGACLLFAVLHAVSRGGASRSRGWGRR